MKTRILWLLFVALAAPAEAGVIPGDAVVAGKTLGEWTAEWWKWVYSVPTNQNSYFDENGSRVHFGQAGPVFFAPGGPPNVSGPALTFSYAVPENKYLLVPVAIGEADNIDVIPPLPTEVLRNLLASIVRGVSELHASLDGVSISFTQDVVSGFFNHRATSPVFSFNFTNADNINTLLYSHQVTGPIEPIIADGYWLMIEPMRPGIHELQTGNTVGFPPFSRSLIHQITVVPVPVPEQLRELIAAVEQTELSARRQRRLLLNLHRAERRFELEHLRKGATQLRLFQRKVRHTLRKDPVLRDQWIQAAQSIMDRAREGLNQ